MKKNLISIIITAATLACFLFLPLVSFPVVKDTSFSLAAIDGANFLALFGANSFKALTGNMCSFAMLLNVAVAIFTIVAAVFHERKAVHLMSIVSVILMFVTYLSGPDGMLDMLGIGYWIALVGFIANVVYTKVFKKDW